MLSYGLSRTICAFGWCVPVSRALLNNVFLAVLKNGHAIFHSWISYNIYNIFQYKILSTVDIHNSVLKSSVFYVTNCEVRCKQLENR